MPLYAGFYTRYPEQKLAWGSGRPMMLLMLLREAGPHDARRSGRSMTCDATDAAATGGMAKQGAHDAADAPCACSGE